MTGARQSVGAPEGDVGGARRAAPVAADHPTQGDTLLCFATLLWLKY